MRWGDIGAAWYLAAVVVAAGLWVYAGVARRHAAERAGNPKLIKDLLATASSEMRLIKQLVVGTAVALVVIALMRPQHGRRPEPLRRVGIDIAVAFDISKSMLARDVQPSRLEGARAQFRQLMTLLTGDRIALVPFAGVAFTQSPLTADQSAIRLYLDSLNPKSMPIGGTNLAMAIREGVRLLTSRGDAAEHRGRSRVLLLVTDGEDVAADQGEDARAAAREAAEAGVHIYAVAVGTRLGEPIPILNADGTHAGYQKDSDGKPIYSKLNMDLLEEIARLADPEHPDDTRVFNYDGKEPVAPKLAQALDGLTKDTLEQMIRHAHGEKFQYALLPAVLLLLLDLLLSERRTRRRDDA